MDEAYDVIVVGGGPAGSTAAAYLSARGYRTILLERGPFPRHRIGESLLPSMMPIIEDFELVEECRRAGFVEKTGATFIWGKTREPWDIRFADTPFLPAGFAFHVERSVFDQILLDCAQRRGAEIQLDAKVVNVVQENGRVCGVTYERGVGGPLATLRAKFVVDASGSASVIGRRVTQRRYDDQMRQIALYSYFKNIRGASDFRRNHIIIESVPQGWFWFIPMNSERLGEVSLGLVTGREFQQEIQKKGTEAFYLDALAAAPHIRELLGPSAIRLKEMHGVRDWAYTCEQTAGPGYYLAGDAAAFLDPLLSTGVSLAMLAGYSASVCIHSALQNPEIESGAAAFYASNYQQMYEITRDFLHYFYAGNATAHPNDLFWEARRVLKFDDNVGAKQAFSFFINTIPGNPHPALAKQIPMFHQFMGNLDHSVNEISTGSGVFRIADGEYKRAIRLEDTDVPVVNGNLESTWRIDRTAHRLEPIRGVSFDRERPVFSSTSSWLLGKNVVPVEDAAFSLMSLMDGKRTWSSVIDEYANTYSLCQELGKEKAIQVVTPLLAADLILVRAAQGSSARGALQ
jgi:flavin-dependent halogenase